MSTDDHEAIRELLARYCHYVDAADTERWVGLYVEDGALAMNMGTPPVEGTEALREFASGRRPGTALHLSANPVIAMDGDEATVESYVVVVSGADEPVVRLAGRYEDRLRRVGGAWKFVRRELHPQFVKRS